MEERSFSSVLGLVALIVGIFGLFYFLIKAHFKLQLALFPQESQETPAPSPTISPIEEKISQMSPEEKIGSLFMVGFNGDKLDEETLEFFQKYHFRHFLLRGGDIENEAQLKRLTDSLKNIASSSGLPVLVAVDQEGGRVDRIDFADIDKTSQLEIKTEDQAYQVAKSRGEALAGLGVNLNFSPVVEIIRNKNAYIKNRAFRAENEQEIASLSAQFVKGYQENRVISVIKHFPGGLGRIPTNPHKDLPILEIDQKELEKDILAFKKLIEDSDIRTIMVTHILYPQIDDQKPSSLSKKFISGILRHDLGFDGVVISDDLAMKAITSQYSIAQAAKQAFLAGVDLILISGSSSDQQEAYETLLQAAETREISIEKMEESVKRILSISNYSNF